MYRHDTETQQRGVPQTGPRVPRGTEKWGRWTGQRAACGRKENFQQWLHKLHPKVHTKERFASRKYRRTFFIRFLRTNRKVVRLNKQTSIWRHWRITKTARTSIKEPNDKRGLVGKIQTWHQFSFWGICVCDRESQKLGECSDREPDMQRSTGCSSEPRAPGRRWSPASISLLPQETAQEFNWDSEELWPKRKGALEIDPHEAQGLPCGFDSQSGHKFPLCHGCGEKVKRRRMKPRIQKTQTLTELKLSAPELTSSKKQK